MWAIFICKGEPVTSCCLFLSNRECYEYKYIRNIKGVAITIINILKNKKICTIFSRGWDIERFKLDSGFDLLKYVIFKHIKEFYCDKTGESRTLPDGTKKNFNRFILCEKLGISPCPMDRPGNPKGTAETLLNIIQKLNE